MKGFVIVTIWLVLGAYDVRCQEESMRLVSDKIDSLEGKIFQFEHSVNKFGQGVSPHRIKTRCRPTRERRHD